MASEKKGVPGAFSLSQKLACRERSDAAAKSRGLALKARKKLQKLRNNSLFPAMPRFRKIGLSDLRGVRDERTASIAKEPVSGSRSRNVSISSLRRSSFLAP